MKFITAILLVTFGSIVTPAQDGTFNFGARHAGLAGASLTLRDEYSLFNNVGGLGGVKHHTIFAGYQNRYSIAEFNILGGGGILAHPVGNAGIGFFKFGDDLFSQQRLHLAIGNSIQAVSLGLGLDWVQHAIESVGTRHVIAIQFGGIAELTPQWVFGAHISNINQATLVSDSGEQLATVMKAGLSYRQTDELMINLEVEKNLDYQEILKVGIEYQVIQRAFVRTGIQTNPFKGAFGLGFYPQHLRFDYAFSNAQNIGSIHEFSLAVTIMQ